MNSENLIIYHGKCYDGFTAAWIAHEFFSGDCELFPGIYREDPPDVTGRNVYIIDFSYPREIMIQLNEQANSLVVLDHHKTAEENCRGLDFCVFDMNRSGAGMAWDFFFPSIDRPDWINMVEDRDLWRHALPDTDNFHAYMASVEMSIKNWDLINSTPTQSMIERGKSIRQYIETWTHKASEFSRVVEIENPYDLKISWRVAAVNVPYMNASETADVLLRKYPEVDFSMGYFQRADGKWQYSLRSLGEFDVSTVARLFGGGGHKTASGFETSELLLMEPYE